MSNNIAVIKTGGKQYKVRTGQTIKVEKLTEEKDAKVKFETLMTASTDGKTLNLGTPSLGEKVEGKIIDQIRDKKITVTKYKNKTRYLRNNGHRQPYTMVEILEIQ